MAAVSMSPLPLRLRPVGTSRLHFTAVGPKLEVWRSHSLQKAATIQFQRRKGLMRPLCIGLSNSGSHPVPLSHPLSDLARDFYSSINAKDMTKLDVLIDDSCVFEDLAFPKPFQGKEVHKYLKNLTEAMGKHVRFSIEDVYEGGESFVGVMWHLEWNSEPIPFTKGYSFYECSRNGEKLRIKRAHVFVESPVKPGKIVLGGFCHEPRSLSSELFKVITLLFDKFPKVPEALFQKPSMIVQYIMKAYKMFVEPFVLPLVVYYTHLWTFASWMIIYALIMVQNLLKFFI